LTRAAIVIEPHVTESGIRTPTGRRRIAAWMVDYFLVAVYMGMLFFATFILTGGTCQVPGVTDPGARQLLGAVTLTLPVVLYFAIAEASARQGTIGKLATRLHVTDTGLGRIGFGRSLLRSGLKFLPWELAHTAVHRVPKTGDIPALVWAALAGSLGLAAVYLFGLFVGRGRTLYDVIAGTRVVEADYLATSTTEPDSGSRESSR
jgi:uncharacterized RDD family membrane protein YckC